jgi:hypothetical protein
MKRCECVCLGVGGRARVRACGPVACRVLPRPALSLGTVLGAGQRLGLVRRPLPPPPQIGRLGWYFLMRTASGRFWCHAIEVEANHIPRTAAAGQARGSAEHLRLEHAPEGAQALGPLTASPPATAGAPSSSAGAECGRRAVFILESVHSD